MSYPDSFFDKTKLIVLGRKEFEVPFRELTACINQTYDSLIAERSITNNFKKLNQIMILHRIFYPAVIDEIIEKAPPDIFK